MRTGDPHPNFSNVLPTLADRLRQARSLAVLTGAGISAESGVPTFRDAQSGLWARYAPHELATPEAFRRNPKLVWDWYEWRRGLVAKARPNPGHRALVEIETRVPDFTLITQNVDGLHRQAGSRKVLELHGNIQRIKCFDENVVIEDQPAGEGSPLGSEVLPPGSDGLPRCPRCGGLLRPDVVWFGETLPREVLRAAVEAAQTCEVFFSIGTSALVHPAASLPYLAIERGAITVEINPAETPLTAEVHCFVQGKAGEVLPELVRLAWGD